MHDGEERSSSEREAVYSEALDQLGQLHSLVKQGRAYLTKRLEDSELKPETESSIAAWLGHAWQLRELKDVGLVENNVELIQLAFNAHDDVARKQFVDTGIWMNLTSGRIQISQTFRPYKAVKFIRSDDSFFQIAQVEELCTYPGDVNPRVRWEAMLPRPMEPKDLEKVHSFSQPDFAAASAKGAGTSAAVCGQIPHGTTTATPPAKAEFDNLVEIAPRYGVENKLPVN